MRVLDRIYQDYAAIDREYADREDRARMRSHLRKSEVWKDKRLHNDQSTFLYLSRDLKGGSTTIAAD